MQVGGRLKEGPVSSAFSKKSFSWIWNLLRGMKKVHRDPLTTDNTSSLSLFLSYIYLIFIVLFLKLEEGPLIFCHSSTYSDRHCSLPSPSSRFVGLFLWSFLILLLINLKDSSIYSAVAQELLYKLWVWEDECFKVH